MLKSMTAFARIEENHSLGKFIWEVRSVNHRYLDVSFRLPEDVRAVEFDLRKQLQDQLSRGKLDCTFKLATTAATQVDLSINEKLVDSLLKQISTLQHKAPQVQPANAMEILTWPGVTETQRVDQTELLQQVQASFNSAVVALSENRKLEGARMRDLIIIRLQELTELVLNVRQHRPTVMAAMRKKIMTRLEDLPIDADPQRIEQELVFLAQKLDVEEELDRLDSHLEELKKVVDSQKPVGRRLDFLMQELNREANTLSSKSADIITTQSAVEMKVCIEQMREQIQNIE